MSQARLRHFCQMTYVNKMSTEVRHQFATELDYESEAILNDSKMLDIAGQLKHFPFQDRRHRANLVQWGTLLTQQANHLRELHAAFQATMNIFYSPKQLLNMFLTQELSRWL